MIVAMNALPHPEQIREIVLRTFAELRGRPVARPDLTETVLIRDGNYYGRAYRAGGLLATLEARSATLNFLTREGQLLRSVCFHGESQLPVPQRQAA
jgi:hypothetical protein